MQFLILFGLPGSGKTFVGKIFAQSFGFYFYDGDNDLPSRMKTAIATKAQVTDDMRDDFFSRLISSMKHLQKKYEKIVIAQTFLKERHRKQISQEVSDAEFILVETEDALREERLLKRTDYPLDLEYARRMCANFDPPSGSYFIIENNTEGEEAVKEQIVRILKRQK